MRAEGAPPLAATNTLASDHISPAPRPAQSRFGPWWPMAKRLAGVAFLLLVVALLVRLAQGVDWAAAGDAVKRLPPTTLALAAVLAASSHLLYSSYDLIGRKLTGHRLPKGRTAAVGFVSYAFNLNLGSLVGGVAFRYKLYSRLGLDTGVITRVLGLSLLTNWLGYIVLAGLTMLLLPPQLPPSWAPSPWLWTAWGAGLLTVAVAYLAACFAGNRLQWQWRGHRFQPPPGRVALLQLVLSASNWALIGAVCWVLLQQRVDYALVLGALLTAAVAGVIAHIPAGLGVIEAVFVALLAPWVAQPEVLAALLAYRALYYLLPLIVALGFLPALSRPVATPALLR